MIRTLSLAGAAIGLALLAPAPASAKPQAPVFQGYVARPAAMPAKTTLIVRDRLWRCDGASGVCRGPASTSSPATACALVAREVGTLATFEAGGRAFDEAALARCNARAAG